MKKSLFKKSMMQFFACVALVAVTGTCFTGCSKEESKEETGKESSKENGEEGSSDGKEDGFKNKDVKGEKINTITEIELKTGNEEITLWEDMYFNKGEGAYSISTNERITDEGIKVWSKSDNSFDFWEAESNYITLNCSKEDVKEFTNDNAIYNLMNRNNKIIHTLESKGAIQNTYIPNIYFDNVCPSYNANQNMFRWKNEGDKLIMVCIDTETGKEIFSYEYKGEFEEYLGSTQYYFGYVTVIEDETYYIGVDTLTGEEIYNKSAKDLENNCSVVVIDSGICEIVREGEEEFLKSITLYGSNNEVNSYNYEGKNIVLWEIYWVFGKDCMILTGGIEKGVYHFDLTPVIEFGEAEPSTSYVKTVGFKDNTLTVIGDPDNMWGDIIIIYNNGEKAVVSEEFRMPGGIDSDIITFEGLDKKSYVTFLDTAVLFEVETAKRNFAWDILAVLTTNSFVFTEKDGTVYTYDMYGKLIRTEDGFTSGDMDCIHSEDYNMLYVCNTDDSIRKKDAQIYNVTNDKVYTLTLEDNEEVVSIIRDRYVVLEKYESLETYSVRMYDLVDKEYMDVATMNIRDGGGTYTDYGYKYDGKVYKFE